MIRDKSISVKQKWDEGPECYVDFQLFMLLYLPRVQKASGRREGLVCCSQFNLHRSSNFKKILQNLSGVYIIEKVTHRIGY